MTKEKQQRSLLSGLLPPKDTTDEHGRAENFGIGARHCDYSAGGRDNNWGEAAKQLLSAFVPKNK